MFDLKAMLKKPAKLNFVALCALLALGACASDAPTRSNGPELRGKIQACKTGDKEVSGVSQCLKDDAACYALSNGNFCTGPRGNVCPTGSVKVPTGAACPTDARCFQVSSDLTCGIRYQ